MPVTQERHYGVSDQADTVKRRKSFYTDG